MSEPKLVSSNWNFDEIAERNADLRCAYEADMRAAHLREQREWHEDEMAALREEMIDDRYEYEKEDAPLLQEDRR